MQAVRALWAYRGFIVGSVRREFQSKYRNSLLGAAWTVLNPLAMIVVYTVIFAQIMRARLPGVESAFAYSIYLCAGVLTWVLWLSNSKSAWIRCIRSSAAASRLVAGRKLARA